MKEIRIRSFIELHQALQAYQKSNLWLFRGQTNPDWDLVPKAGRPPFIDTDDEIAFEAWSRRSVEFASTPADDWDVLAIAQHHGLATRLLDWSYNPLAAAFFASMDDHDSDAVIYAYRSVWYVQRQNVEPFNYEGVARFKPRGVAQRITRQGGIFTIHGPPDLRLDDALHEGDVLERIIIDQSYLAQLTFDLSYYGVNRVSLFPDLDGLAGHMNWTMANRGFWSGGGDPVVDVELEGG